MPQATQDAPTKKIEFEGQTHEFPADFSDADISKALSSLPKPAKSAPTTLPKISKINQASEDMSDVGSTIAGVVRHPLRTARGAALGATEAAGFPQTTSAGENVAGFAKNVAGSVYNVGKAFVQDVVGPEGGIQSSHVYGLLDNMAKNLEQSGGEAWKGVKEKDPELFAHGIGSMITQVVMMKESDRLASKIDKGPGLAKTTGKLAVATDIPSELFDKLKKSMPDIITQAAQRGVKTVGELRDAVKQAKQGIDQQFNLGLASIAHSIHMPNEISRRILNLETPDMKKTADGRAEIAELRRAAREYQRPWTIQELNAKRTTENNNLTSFYGKDSSGQAAALNKLQTDISKAVRDGASEIVYREWDKANPGPAARDMKGRQGALWAMDDFLTEKARDLETKQAKHEAMGPFAKVNAHAIASGGGVHAYFSGLGQAFSEGPGAKANKYVQEGFQPTMAQRAKRIGVLSLPISLLARDKSSKSAPEPPPQMD